MAVQLREEIVKYLYVNTAKDLNYRLVVDGESLFKDSLTINFNAPLLKLIDTATTPNSGQLSIDANGYTNLQASNHLYLRSGASKEIVFYTNTSARAKFNSSGHFLPGAVDTYDMGTSSTRWKAIYANNIYATNTASDSYRTVEVENSNGGVALQASNNRGLRDLTSQTWIIYTRATSNSTDTGIANLLHLEKGAISYDNITPSTSNTYTLGSSSYKWKNIYSTQFNGDHNGTISGVVESDPSGNTYYSVLFIATEDKAAVETTKYTRLANKDFNFYVMNGTAETEGHATIVLGNTTATGTTGNKRGRLRLYGTNTGYATLQYTNSTASPSITIPEYGGYLTVSASSTQNYTSEKAAYVPFYTQSYKQLGMNNGFRYYTLEGTAEALGYGKLYLGNGTSSGTAGNKYGLLKLYNINGVSVDVRGNELGSYGGLRVSGLKGSYHGILLGNTTSALTIMSKDGSDQGLYNEAIPKWLFYHNGTGSICLLGSSVVADYPIVLNATTNIKGNVLADATGETNRSIRVKNDNGEVGIYTSANRGLYDFKDKQWIIYAKKDVANRAYIPSGKGLTVENATEAESPTTGALVVSGGVGVATNIYSGQKINAAQGFGVNATTGTGVGISLYNGSNGTSAPTYGLMFAKTANFGTHGSVSGDWATYFTMSETTTKQRGWIFRHTTNNVVSIAGNGDITLNGNVSPNTNNSGTVGTSSYNWSAVHARALTSAAALSVTSTNAMTLTSGDTTTLSSSSTINLKTTASASIVFYINGSERARFNTSGNLVPYADKTYNIGSSSASWNNIYGYKIWAATNGQSYGYLTVQTVGTTSTQGIGRLTLGNNISSGTDKNARGQILFYGTGSAYLTMYSSVTSNRTWYFRDHGADAYSVATTTTNAVGSTTVPVYINANGIVTACSSLWTNSTTSSTSEFQVGARSAAGTIYMYAQGTTTGSRGIYGANNGGTQVSILSVSSDNVVSLNGNASTATKLANARNLKVALGSTSAQSFDGSAAATSIGVSGTLAVSNGGTGTTTAPTAGGVIYGSSASAYGCTAAGTSGQLLQSGASGAPSWITATSSNTASTVVKRNSSGNFSAGTITATLSGNASTASKWASARKITVGKDYAGSVSIDGSADKTLDITAYKVTAGGNNTNTYPWRRIAYINNASSGYSDYDCVLDIRATYDSTRFGRIKISYRTNNSSTGAAISCHARWIYRSGFSLSDLVIASWGASGQACYADVFLNCGGSWPRLEINQVYGERKWTLVTSSEATDAASRTEAYATVAAAGTELHSKAYTGTWNSEDAPVVVSSATKATTDDSGNTITSYYCTLSTSQTISGTKTHSADIVMSGAACVRSAHVGGSYYAARDTALVIHTAHTASSSYSPVYSLKGASGDFSSGLIHYASGESRIEWRYTPNTSYTNKTNDGIALLAYLNHSGEFSATKVKGAVWNDYAEYREGEFAEAGRVVKETKEGILKITTARLEPGCEIISDTFGFAIGETDKCNTPIAVAGRVLAYPFEDRNSYELGQAVCSGPNGTVSKMTREEIMMYPERIIGTVSEIPNYETWGSGNVPVNGRIWIRIR